MADEKSDDGAHFLDQFGGKLKDIAMRMKNEDDELYDSEELHEMLSEIFKGFKDSFNGYFERSFPDGSNIHDVDFEYGINLYVNKDGDGCKFEELNLIALVTEHYCDDLGVSTKVYGVNVFSSLLLLAKKNESAAYSYLKVVLQNLFNALRIESTPSDFGKLGGRPEHIRKGEAMTLAKKRWSDIPFASLNDVCLYVHRSLTTSYTDAPSLSTITNWVRNAEFRPCKKSKSMKIA